MDIREFIEAHEDGYTEDHAGPTNHGVSFRFLRNLHPSMADIDGDGDVDFDDIRNMTKDRAWALFTDVLFIPSGIYLVSGILSYALMDAAVNMGAGTSVKMLQRVMNRIGAKLKVDGVIGPKTIAAIGPIPKMWLTSEFLLERVTRYKKIVDNNKTLGWAFKGWIRRVVDLKKFIDDGE